MIYEFSINNIPFYLVLMQGQFYLQIDYFDSRVIRGLRDSPNTINEIMIFCRRKTDEIGRIEHTFKMLAYGAYGFLRCVDSGEASMDDIDFCLNSDLITDRQRQQLLDLPLQFNLAKIGKVKKTKGISGYVYVLKSDNPEFSYKIGKSQGVEKRREALEKQMKMKLQLIHTFPADDYTLAENALHRQFADRLINGEWFDLTPEDVDYIKSIAEYSGGEFMISEAQ